MPFFLWVLSLVIRNQCQSLFPPVRKLQTMINVPSVSSRPIDFSCSSIWLFLYTLHHLCSTPSESLQQFNVFLILQHPKLPPHSRCTGHSSAEQSRANPSLAQLAVQCALLAARSHHSFLYIPSFSLENHRILKPERYSRSSVQPPSQHNHCHL